MTTESLAALAGSALSLALFYIPGLKAKYDVLTSEGKASVMALALVGVTLVITGLACANILSYFGLTVECTAQSLIDLLKVLAAALVANQTTYLMFVRPYKKDEPAPQAA